MGRAPDGVPLGVVVVLGGAVGLVAVRDGALLDRWVVVAPPLGRGAGAVRAGVVRAGAGAGRRGAGAAASYDSLANSKKLLMSLLALLAREPRIRQIRKSRSRTR